MSGTNDAMPYGAGKPIADTTAYGMCPWMGKPCVGERNCAPAKLSSTLSQDGTEVPNCPIKSVADVVMAAGVMLAPMLDRLIGVQDTEKSNKNKDREEVMRSLKIDQEPDYDKAQ